MLAFVTHVICKWSVSSDLSKVVDACCGLRAKKEAELEKRFSAVHLDPELVLAAKEVELREEEARQAAAKEQLRLKEELKVRLPI